MSKQLTTQHEGDLEMLKTGRAEGNANRAAAIRRFLRDVAGATDPDWISEHIDRLQIELGCVHGANVARALGFNV